MNLELNNENIRSILVGGIATIILAVLALIFYPLIGIFAINTLFPMLSIPYNFWTWGSMLFIKAYFFRTKTTS